MRPGAPSRLGEAAVMVPHLEALYGEVLRIEGDGFIEGGDILTTEREILIGLSARTDQAGVDGFARLVDRWGYRVRIVDTPTGVLHFKTDCSLLDEDTCWQPNGWTRRVVLKVTRFCTPQTVKKPAPIPFVSTTW